jgi:hypothetical protein
MNTVVKLPTVPAVQDMPEANEGETPIISVSNSTSVKEDCQEPIQSGYIKQSIAPDKGPIKGSPTMEIDRVLSRLQVQGLSISTSTPTLPLMNHSKEPISIKSKMKRASKPSLGRGRRKASLN